MRNLSLKVYGQLVQLRRNGGTYGMHDDCVRALEADLEAAGMSVMGELVPMGPLTSPGVECGRCGQQIGSVVTD